MSNGLPVSEMDFDGLISHEWLCLNSIGGYASSTAACLNTRRYHGLLVAAMAPPARRMVLLSRLEEVIRADGSEFFLACNEYPGTLWPRGHELLRAFAPDPVPRWAYQGDGWTLLKQLRFLPGENTVVLTYTLLAAPGPVDLELRPLLALRGIHELSYQWNGKLAAVQRLGETQQGRSRNHWHVAPTGRTPEVFFAHEGVFDQRANWYLNTIYRREKERGYPGLEDLWSPGAAHVRLSPGQSTHFACSAEPLELADVVARSERMITSAGILGGARPPSQMDETAMVSPPADPWRDAMVQSAAAYVLKTGERSAGQSLGAVAQYHWGAPSSRAAMIGITGLTLIPGRFDDARSLLLATAARLHDGLIPSELPEDGSPPVYRGADVSLWFVNAVRQYLLYTHDESTVARDLMPAIWEILHACRRGTDLGIHSDPDGLLVSGIAEVGCTWMDAGIADGLVTPRHGRAVEINALWYNTIRSAAEMSAQLEGDNAPLPAEKLGALACSVRTAFNRRFWNDAAQCCFDLIGEADSPSDASIRPNQLFAVSLPFPVLPAERQAAVVRRVKQELLIPFGVRTLSPADPAYVGRYRGDIVSRDRACHNGSAFPWLLGPLVTAMVRVGNGSEAARIEARALIEPCIRRLLGPGCFHLCELFDGDAPFRPGGAIASPLAVAELLRSYAQDVLGETPPAGMGTARVSVSRSI